MPSAQPTDVDHAAPGLTDAVRILEEVFGYKNFRGQQSQIIDALLGGFDALALMPTGGGKSLCYQIPALARSGTGIVVSPLIALMQDQVDALREVGVEAAFLNSTQSYDEQQNVAARLRDGELDMLYVAPERLVQDRTLEMLDHVELSVIAIDEAHCVSQWGHDFRPEYRQLKILAARFAGVPRVALTATADERTRAEIVSELDLGQAQQFVASFDRPNIRYQISEPGSMSARERLWQFIEADHPKDAGIIYCMSRRSVDETAQWLVKRGRSALGYHAGMAADERRHVQTRFLVEDGLIIVATIAFGMGIDKPDVRFVAHLNLPKTIEAYYQETGRAGRDGAPASAWLAYGMQDIIQQRQWIEQSDGSDAFKKIQRRKLNALIGMVEMIGCRRQALLAYFNEQMAEPCGNCDNCLSPPKTVDATKFAQMALSTVYRTEQRFGVTYLVDVLLGKPDERIVRNRHDKLSVFGIGKDMDANGWRSLFRQLASAGYLVGDREGHGTLLLGDVARSLLRGEQAFAMRSPPKRSSRPAKDNRRKISRAEIALPPQDQALFDALRAARLKLAKSSKVPPYVICHDRTLVELASKRPGKLKELHDITGLGASKIKKYGKVLLAEINGFKLHPMLDNKLSATINETLARYVQDMLPEAIATERGLELETVMGHFAEAIDAGLMEARDVVGLDAGQIDEIHAAFEDHNVMETGKLAPVHAAFEGRYGYGVLKCLLAELS